MGFASLHLSNEVLRRDAIGKTARQVTPHFAENAAPP
jgi:hypothetical protein